MPAESVDEINYGGMSLASLRLDYLPSTDLVSRPASWWHDVLGVAGFDRPPPTDAVRMPVTASLTPSLDGAPSLSEVWRVTGGKRGELSTRTIDDCHLRYRFNDDFLFGSLMVDERRFEGSPSAALRAATLAAYRGVFSVLERVGHPHLTRVWNYLPDINGEADGDERYRHFNAARQAAFRDAGRSTVGTVPAASALGSPAGGSISIYFLASRQPPIMIENPRQISAYHYPAQFGEHSPTFSRACILGDSTGTNLFISGTASIVGYETLHRDDVIAQTRETLVNIDALVSEANRIVGAARYALEALKLKVYVRRPVDLAAIQAVLAQSMRPSTSAIFLRADVCREELLVEIEATGDADGS